MNVPIISIKDRDVVRQMATNMPHALLIIAEPGLDSAGTAEHLTSAVASDIFRIQPLEKATAITIEQIRDLSAALRTHSQTRRVVIINPAVNMTEAAQNALLKTLEEPSSNTHFILIATSTEHILPTVRSRCQALLLHRTLPAQDEALLENTKITDTERRQILFLAAGRPLLINKLIRNPREFATYQTLAADAKRILSPSRPYEALVAALSHATREDALALIDILLGFIKFQLYTTPTDSRLHELADRAISSEKALQANGNVRLALLKLVV